MARKKLGEILVLAGAIDELQLQSALGAQRRWGGALGATLVSMGLIDEDTLVKALSAQLNFPGVKLDDIPIPPDVLNYLDLKFCQEYSCIPFRFEEKGNFLDVAMADPTNSLVFDEVRVRTRCNLRPHIAGPQAIEKALRFYYLGESYTPPNPGEDRSWYTRPDEIEFDLGGPPAPPPRAQPAQPAPQPAVSSARAAAPAGAPADPAGTPAPRMSATVRDELLIQLHSMMKQVRAQLERDEKVLRKLMSLIVEKGLCTREELVAKIHED